MTATAKDRPARLLAARAGRQALVGFATLLTGLQARWATAPQALPTIYFANHASHVDFVLVWAALPPDLRGRTRPVAGADYWLASPLRRFVGHDVVHALMIRRDGSAPGNDPVGAMADVVAGGDSLILFPEGTRNTGDDVLLPFKSGLYHLAQRCRQARLVPVWIENPGRVMPKGMLLPVPLACSVEFGQPLERHDGDDKRAFLERARDALLALRPHAASEAGR